MDQFVALDARTRGGMMIGMTAKEKIAVSLSARALASARKAVRSGRAPSVSAYVEKAITEKATLDDLSSLLDEMLAESGGPLTSAERRSADRILRGKKKR